MRTPCYQLCGLTYVWWSAARLYVIAPSILNDVIRLIKVIHHSHPAKVWERMYDTSVSVVDKLSPSIYPGPLFTKRSTSYRNISWSLEAARFASRLFQSPWNLTGCCRDACQISERYDHYNIQSRSFETSRDRAVKCPSAKVNKGHRPSI